MLCWRYCSYVVVSANIRRLNYSVPPPSSCIYIHLQFTFLISSFIFFLFLPSYIYFISICFIIQYAFLYLANHTHILITLHNYITVSSIYQSLYLSTIYLSQVDRLEDELVGEQEKFKAITEELDQTFAEMSGY